MNTIKKALDFSETLQIKNKRPLTVIANAAQYTQELIRVDVVLCYQYDSERNELACRFCSEPISPALETALEPLVKQSMLTHALSACTIPGDLSAQGFPTAVAALIQPPAVAMYGPLSVVLLRRRAEDFTEEDNLALHVLWKAALSAMLAQHLHGLLEEEGWRSPTTGMPNYRALIGSIQTALAEGLTAGALVMGDLYHFTRFVAQYNDGTADLVKQELGSCIARVTPPDTFVAHIASDIFAWWLPGYAQDQAEQFTEDLLAQIEATRFLVPDHEPITFSMGIACYPRIGSTPEALFEAADKAMNAAARQVGGRRILSAQSFMTRLGQDS